LQGDLNRHIKNIHVEGKKPRKRRVQQVDWQTEAEFLDADNNEHSDTHIDVMVGAAGEYQQLSAF